MKRLIALFLLSLALAGCVAIDPRPYPPPILPPPPIYPVPPPPLYPVPPPY
ncbi:MAG: hypothetical protein H7843_10500 [Nitrospirota bacterium]